MLTVTDNPEAQRYEGRVGDAVAGTVDYYLRPGLITVVHTEVRDGLAGEGVGSLLVAGMLDDIRARGLKIVPMCPFTRGYIERHPEYADLVGYG
jgi:uncharacterized protein